MVLASFAGKAMMCHPGVGALSELCPCLVGLLEACAASCSFCALTPCSVFSCVLDWLHLCAAGRHTFCRFCCALLVVVVQLCIGQLLQHPSCCPCWPLLVCNVRDFSGVQGSKSCMLLARHTMCRRCSSGSCAAHPVGPRSRVYRCYFAWHGRFMPCVAVACCLLGDWDCSGGLGLHRV